MFQPLPTWALWYSRSSSTQLKVSFPSLWTVQVWSLHPSLSLSTLIESANASKPDVTNSRGWKPPGRPSSTCTGRRSAWSRPPWRSWAFPPCRPHWRPEPPLGLSGLLLGTGRCLCPLGRTDGVTGGERRTSCGGHGHRDGDGGESAANRTAASITDHGEAPWDLLCVLNSTWCVLSLIGSLSRGSDSAPTGAGCLCLPCRSPSVSARSDECRMRWTASSSCCTPTTSRAARGSSGEGCGGE